MRETKNNLFFFSDGERITNKNETSDNVAHFYNNTNDIVKASKSGLAISYNHINYNDYNAVYVGLYTPSEKAIHTYTVKVYERKVINKTDYVKHNKPQLIVHRAIPVGFQPNTIYYSTKNLHQKNYVTIKNEGSESREPNVDDCKVYHVGDNVADILEFTPKDIRYNCDGTRKYMSDLSYCNSEYDSMFNEYPNLRKYFKLEGKKVICTAPLYKPNTIIKDTIKYSSKYKWQYFLKSQQRSEYDGSDYNRIHPNTTNVKYVGKWRKVFKKQEDGIKVYKNRMLHASYIKITRNYRGYKSVNSAVYRPIPLKYSKESVERTFEYIQIQ